MNRIAHTCLIVLLALPISVAAPARGGETGKPRVQVALLLDTSGSMDGLLNQAKTQLWKVVNELALSKRGGQRPEIQVALYEYGKQSIPASQHFLRQILPLTTDLDKVSEELFALKTNGGEEYCGHVIAAAVGGLQWSGSEKDFKALFIAGNESFAQGDLDFHQACRDAIAKGILVNTIFCGPREEGITLKWQEGAQLADGSFMQIDQNRVVAQVQAPQDEELAKLGVGLSRTYLAYGKKGGEALLRQAEQDKNAQGAGAPVAAERAMAKAGAAYEAGSWDLVDAVKEKKVDAKELSAEDLPAEMRDMDAGKRAEFVAAKAGERQQLQAKIVELSEARRKYVAEEMKKQAAAGGDSLDAAIIKVIREQAAKKDFKFE